MLALIGLRQNFPFNQAIRIEAILNDLKEKGISLEGCSPDGAN